MDKLNSTYAVLKKLENEDRTQLNSTHGRIEFLRDKLNSTYAVLKKLENEERTQHMRKFISFKSTSLLVRVRGGLEPLRAASLPWEAATGPQVRPQHMRKLLTHVCELAHDAEDLIDALQSTGRYEHEDLMKLIQKSRKLRVRRKIGNRIKEHKARINEVDPTAECPEPRAQVGLLSWGALCKKIKGTSALLDHIRTVILVCCTPADDQIQEQRKRCAAYSQKALLFAITTFVAYLGSASASTGSMSFKITMASCFVAMFVDLISATRTPDWGIALVYLSWSLLVLVSYLLLISFNKNYGYAILPVPLPIVISFLIQRKQHTGARQLCNTEAEAAGQDLAPDIEACQCLNVDRSAQDLNIQNKADEYVNSEDQSSRALNTSNEHDQDVNTNDEADQDLDGIFNLSAGIVNCGGFISIVLGHYLVGPNQLIAVNAVGFLFFFTVVLGLYVMMVTTVRKAALTLHLSQLSFLLMALLMSTLVATVIYGVPRSEKDSHV